MIRLCYASARRGIASDLIEDLSHILTLAKTFNHENKIYGVLYYANNYFFQCLEGDKATVLELYDRIKKDSRHQDILEFELKYIEHASFQNWSMKYVQQCSRAEAFFKELGSDTFNPLLLNEDHLATFLHELLIEKQTKVKRKIGIKQRGITSYL